MAVLRGSRLYSAHAQGIRGSGRSHYPYQYRRRILFDLQARHERRVPALRRSPSESLSRRVRFPIQQSQGSRNRRRAARGNSSARGKRQAAYLCYSSLARSRNETGECCMPKKKRRDTQQKQSQRFVDTARKLEADKSGESFKRAFAVVVKPK